MAKRIYLSPSSQTANTYAAGNTNEAAQCRKIALAAKAALERCGFEAKTNVTAGKSMYDRVRESNAWDADLHVPIHTNAFNKKLKGTRMFCSSLTGEGGKACKAILATLAPIVDGDSDNVQTADFYEITASNAPCAYVEAAFHDNAEQAAWIIAHVVDIGEAICKGICNHYGVKYVAPAAAAEKQPEESSKTNVFYRVQVGAFNERKNAEKMHDELKAKGYDSAFIVEVTR